MREAGKSTSRQRSAISSPRRSPVKAAVRQIAASCSVAAAPAQRADLFGREDVKIQPLRWRSFSTSDAG
jgi:hypothetical protein